MDAFRPGMAGWRRATSVVALSLVAGAALAQPGGSTGSDGGSGGAGGPVIEAVRVEYAPAEAIKPYVDLLDLDDYAAREGATEFIYQTPSVTLQTVEPYLLDPSLSPEARSRLEAIGDVLFRVTSRAAMGVQFERTGGPRVVIRSAVEDLTGMFRAGEVVKAGDEVVLADGEPVSSNDEFQAAILSHDPYETMSLRVRRAGELLDVTVPLGDFNRLAGGNLPPDSVMRMAWERRLARIRASAGAGAGALTPVLDLRGEGVAAGEGLSPPPDQRSLPARVRDALLVAAGSTRGGVEQSGAAIEPRPIELDAIAVEVQDYLRQQGLAEIDIAEAQRQLEPLLEMQRQLMDRRARILENIRLTQARLDDPDLDQVERRRFNEQLVRLERTLAETQNQINAVNSVLPIGR